MKMQSYTLSQLVRLQLNATRQDWESVLKRDMRLDRDEAQSFSNGIVDLGLIQYLIAFRVSDSDIANIIDIAIGHLLITLDIEDK